METLNKGFLIRNGVCVGIGGQVSKRVTQQEYDNLGDEKYDDNILYFITDGTDEGFGINDGVVSEFSTYSSSKIEDELAKIPSFTKTTYYGSRSVDINTAGRLTFIFSSMYASQAGCYMLLSNYNSEPTLITLGLNGSGQFRVTATRKSNGVDTITVTAAGSDYSWNVLQF